MKYKGIELEGLDKDVKLLCEAYAQYLCKSYGID